jgi:hypothetical protein
MTERNIDDYYRVTEILSTYSKMDKIPPAVLERACDRGTAVHKICTAILQNMGVPEVPEGYQGYIESFNQWHQCFCHGCTFVFPQRFFYDSDMITGECDCIMIDSKGRNFLIDFKTSASESKTWALQAAAYRFLCESEGLVIEEVIFIKLSKDGSVPKLIKYDYQTNMTLFRYALDLHQYFNPKKKKKQDEE